MRDISFLEFSQTNRQRCEAPNGFRHPISGWSLSDWGIALVGEVGEACNVIKKMNRYRDNIPGNKESLNQLNEKLFKEFGDAGVYLDLCCQAAGFSMVDAMVTVFNQKSMELNCPILIR